MLPFFLFFGCFFFSKMQTLGSNVLFFSYYSQAIIEKKGLTFDNFYPQKKCYVLTIPVLAVEPKVGRK